MTSSTRFIGLAVFAWAGVRAFSLGLIPGSEAWALDAAPAAASRPALPPIQQTEFAPIDAPAPVDRQTPPIDARVGSSAAAPATYPVYTPMPAMLRTGQSPGRVRLARYDAPPPLRRIAYGASPLTTDLPEPRRPTYGAAPLTTELPPARVASAEAMPRGPAPSWAEDAPIVAPHRRKLELSSWALMRGKPGDLLGSNGLSASSGTLGGSQAGARVSYWFTPHLAASVRSSTPLGGARGGEVAAGVRYQPFLKVPFSITAERRQRFGRAGERNDFALFMEGGLWDRPMPLGFRLDAYAQAGVVGIQSRDLFADGAFTLTRHLWRNLSAGFGMWGGAQPHLYRLDAGPRLTIGMTKSMRVHLDYRQRLAGSAYPSSGPAVTIAGDF